MSHPFTTLEAARDAVRALRRSGKELTAVQVLIAPGVYRLSKPSIFTPEDGGTARHSVTWSGVCFRSLISGAQEISDWT